MRMLSVNIECIIYSETTKKQFKKQRRENGKQGISCPQEFYKAALKFSKYLLEIIENGLRFLVTFYAQQT